RFGLTHNRISILTCCSLGQRYIEALHRFHQATGIKYEMLLNTPDEILSDAGLSKSDGMSDNDRSTWRNRHQQLLEFVLVNPAAKRKLCARATGYSPWQVSRIMNSTEFRERLEQAYRLRMTESARLRASSSKPW